MSEGGAGGEGTDAVGESNGYGIDAAIAAIENAAPGSISMGISDISGTAFEGAAAGDLGSGISVSAPAQNATMGLGTGITPGAAGLLEYGASSELGRGGGSVDTGGMGGEPGRAAGTPAPEKPKGVSVADEVRADAATRVARNSQRAAAASVTRNDNDAYLLGYTTPKLKATRRTLLGA